MLKSVFQAVKTLWTVCDSFSMVYQTRESQLSNFITLQLLPDIYCRYDTSPPQWSEQIQSAHENMWPNSTLFRLNSALFRLNSTLFRLRCRPWPIWIHIYHLMVSHTHTWRILNMSIGLALPAPLRFLFLAHPQHHPGLVPLLHTANVSCSSSSPSWLGSSLAHCKCFLLLLITILAWFLSCTLQMFLAHPQHHPGLVPLLHTANVSCSSSSPSWLGSSLAHCKCAHMWNNAYCKCVCVKITIIYV